MACQRLETPVTLEDGKEMRLGLLSANGIKTNMALEADPERYVGKVYRLALFTNAKENGLGNVLPAGPLRVFLQGNAEEPTLVSDQIMPMVQEGGEVRLVMGTEPDLSVERTQLDRRTVGNQFEDRTLRVILRSQRKQPVEVRVLERLPAGVRTWSVEETTHPYARVPSERVADRLPRERELSGEEGQYSSARANPETVVFTVPVPAQGEATLQFRIRTTRSGGY